MCRANSIVFASDFKEAQLNHTDMGYQPELSGLKL